MYAITDQPLDILVIEHEVAARQALVDGLRLAGHRIVPFADASECLSDVVPNDFDLAFIPQDTGDAHCSLAKLCKRCPRMRVVLTGANGVTSDVACGAHEVVGCVRTPVPVEYAQQLARCVAKLRAMEEELADLRGSNQLAAQIPIIQPGNTRMRRVIDRARHLAHDSAPLLLRGEFGVGKRVLASLIHQWGACAQSPCILVASSEDSPTSPREVAELLRRSDSRGTLVFEEIGEFTLKQQGEILALFGTNEVSHDADETLSAGIKILATTSKDLAAAAKKGEFREELLSFLMDEVLYIPPLRERPEDIVSLADHILTHLSHLYHRPGLSLEPEARLALLRDSWPGNVHELRNAIERVVLTAKRPQIGESDFRLRPVADSSRSRSGNFLSLDAMEKQHIQRVMRASPTLEEAARILQVDITTVWRKRRRYGI